MNRYLSIILIALFAFAGYAAAAHVHHDDCEDHEGSCTLCLLANNTSSPISTTAYDLQVVFFTPFRHFISSGRTHFLRNGCFIPSPRAPPLVEIGHL